MVYKSQFRPDLLIKLSLGTWKPLTVKDINEFLRLEPETNLVVGRLDSIRSVADVTSNMDCEVTPDGAWLGVSWVCLSQHATTSLHCVETLPDHGANWAAGHVLH